MDVLKIIFFIFLTFIMMSMVYSLVLLLQNKIKPSKSGAILSFVVFFSMVISMILNKSFNIWAVFWLVAGIIEFFKLNESKKQN
ncbi:hypothetical protein R0131_17955 [Clostridium sp. AL.422]|uniref:hypothetical protein n=1 Tax=Clostridium TaxID=1485 RepID=UPI00293DF66E|nr:MULTISPECIES: hypothetical protein [unclassified Clostridium]MDV4152716.1 hypothetical protein [Clostridium sp. AL.422]